MTAIFIRLSGIISLITVAMIVVVSVIGANIPTRIMIYTGEQGQSYGLFDLNTCISKISNGEHPYIDFAWSPNGEQIAFVELSQESGVYVMDWTGANLRPVATSQHREVSPAWAANNRLAFISNQSGLYNPYMIDLETQELTRIFNREDAAIYQIGFHPHLNYAAITVQPIGSDLMHLELVNLETGETTIITPAHHSPIYEPIWSPDGTRLLYHRYTSVHMLTFSDDLSSFSAPELIEIPPTVIRYKAWWSNDEILISLPHYYSEVLFTFGLIKLEASDYSSVAYVPTPCMPQGAYSAALSP